jgi:hypothetical protein
MLYRVSCVLTVNSINILYIIVSHNIVESSADGTPAICVCVCVYVCMCVYVCVCICVCVYVCVCV